MEISEKSLGFRILANPIFCSEASDYYYQILQKFDYKGEIEVNFM